MFKSIRFLSAKEVAAILGCSVLAANIIMLEDDFPSIKIGNYIRVSEESFKMWIKTHK